jgi:hypothetical protein
MVMYDTQTVQCNAMASQDLVSWIELWNFHELCVLLLSKHPGKFGATKQQPKILTALEDNILSFQNTESYKNKKESAVEHKS